MRVLQCFYDMRTRDLILEEALRLFSEKGIKETTMRDIARGVGITEGAIYRHFRSKEEIVRELFETYSGELYSRIEKAIGRSGSEEERFKGAVRVFLDFAFKHPDAFRYLNVFHYLRGEEVRKFRRIPFSLLRDLVLELRDKNLLRVDPEYALAMLIGTLERVFLYKAMGLLKGRRSEVKDKTAEFLWSALTGGERHTVR